MKALLLNDGELRVGRTEDPSAGPGQVLARTLACAICASDHHMVHHGRRLADWSNNHDGPFHFDPDQDLVLGHELCAEIVEFGPETDRVLPLGQRVVGPPTLFHPGGMAVLGYSNDYPGGFGEYLLMSESVLLAVPDAVTTDQAALVEPLSVGMQYARVADIAPGEVPLVIGCGAIGIAVIAALRRQGVRPIVAADFSPMRRATAAASGADEVVDPAEETAFAAWARLAPRGARCVIVECVGASGVLNGIFTDAPWFSRVIVAGQNLDDDVFFTASAHTKMLNVQFGSLPIPADFVHALGAIADGSIDVSGWLTGTALLDDAVDAFARSADTETHTRLVIHPA
ncbi:MAG: alcohol dehydrogenase catalytic domain-containing protein [Acidimicrobiia bacterium]|nr:alcohol dehydrogenase catalytic domain-containing protein [Acidimicrobiia bacterium]